jgi:hypothetical protein
MGEDPEPLRGLWSGPYMDQTGTQRKQKCSEKIPGGESMSKADDPVGSNGLHACSWRALVLQSFSRRIAKNYSLFPARNQDFQTKIFQRRLARVASAAAETTIIIKHSVAQLARFVFIFITYLS